MDATFDEETYKERIAELRNAILAKQVELSETKSRQLQSEMSGETF